MRSHHWSPHLPLILLLILFIEVQASIWQQEPTDECFIPMDGNNQNSQFETGYFEVLAFVPSVRENRYRVGYVDGYSGVPDIGITIVSLQSYMDEEGIDFQVRSIANRTFFDAIFQISTSTNWSLAHFHYLASSRQDVYIDTFQIQHPSLLDPTPTSFELSLPSKKTFPQDIRLLSYVDITGLKSQQIQFGLSINPSGVYFKNNTISMMVWLRNMRKPVEMLVLTFYGFQVQMKMEGGEIGEEGRLYLQEVRLPKVFTISSYLKNKLDFQGLFADYLFGLTAYDGSKIKSKHADQIPAFNNIFKLQLIAKAQSQLPKNYPPIPIISPPSPDPIFTLPKNTQKSLQQIVTQKNCLISQHCKYYNGKQFDNYCFYCPINEKFTGLRCGCVNGYVRVNGVCRRDDYDLEYCRVERNVVEGRRWGYGGQVECVCEEFYEKKLDMYGKMWCVPICPPEFPLSDNTMSCACPHGTYFQKGKCQKCDDFSEWDAASRKCVCSKNSSPNKDGKCIPCYQIPNILSCTCVPGAFRMGCIPDGTRGVGL